jgi:hypothetical protein
MKTIKNIVIVGTSFTAGGGFEEISEVRKILTKYETIPAKMEDCAWPAFLKKNLNGINVYNLAIPGAGIDYLIRTTTEWINKNPIIYKDTLFLLEMSGYGRLELWSNEFDRYLVCNWDYGVRRKNFCAGLHTGSYWKESLEFAAKISKNDELVIKWLDAFADPMMMVEHIQERMFNFLCRLKYMGLEFKIFSEGFCNPFLDEDPLIQDNCLKLNSSNGEYRSIHHYLIDTKLQIKDFTNGECDDFHGTLQANRIIAEQYYAQLKAIYNI